MSRRKRTWEAVSFEVVMTLVALVALGVIIAPSLVVLIVSFTSGYSLKFPPPGYSARVSQRSSSSATRVMRITRSISGTRRSF